MSPIKLITSGVNVAPMLWALHSNPQLWDQNPDRTESPDSPHYGVHDIWVRYAAPGVDRTKPHDAVWYPGAELLPVRDLVYPLMSHVQGDRLGGILITKIKPGQSVKPHTDPGWHARFYQKFAIQIQSHPQQAFCFEDAELVTKPGDVYWFDNSQTHWVTNESDQDRITLIVCVLTDKEF